MSETQLAYSNNDLVTVAIPAFNAARTISETLESVLVQTHCALEVFVVDDGSTDGTGNIVKSFAARDKRVTLITTSNGGVAKARNLAAAAGRGSFIAPVDADDLWHPSKIEDQVEAIRRAGPRAGFVYAFYRRITEDGHVRYDGSPTVCEGSVFMRLIMNNFVGNGSALLIRREAFNEVGGYDPRLQLRGAQGCEDYLIQTMIARSWSVVAVRKFLVGYRESPGTMSENWERMFRSNLEMLEIIRTAAPEVPPEALAVAEAAVLARRGSKRLCHFRIAAGVTDIGCALLRSRGPALIALRNEARQRFASASKYMRRLSSEGRSGDEGRIKGRRFVDIDPSEGLRMARPHPLDRWMRRYAQEALPCGVGRVPGGGVARR